MSGQVFGPGVHFDAGNNSRSVEDFKKGGAVLLLLANGFVIKDHTADALPQPGRSDDQFPIRAPGLHRLRNAQLCKTLVAGWVAFIHGQQAFVVVNQLSRIICKCLGIHGYFPVASKSGCCDWRCGPQAKSLVIKYTIMAASTNTTPIQTRQSRCARVQ